MPKIKELRTVATEKQLKRKLQKAKLTELKAKRGKGQLKLEDIDEKLDLIIELLENEK